MYLVMIPIYDAASSNAASGIARSYAIDDNGKSVLKWEIRGWYAFPRFLHLNGNGSCLVRVHDIGEVSPTGEPDKVENKKEKFGKESLLSFYYRGKLVKDFKFDEVVTKYDPKIEYGSPYYPIVRSVKFLPLRYVWEMFSVPELKDMSEDDKRFAEAVSIITVENEEIFFRVSDGFLLYRHVSDSSDNEK